MRSLVMVSYPPEKVRDECRADPQRIQSCDVEDGVEGGNRRRPHDTEPGPEPSLQDSSEEGLVSGRVKNKDSHLKVGRIRRRGDQRVDRSLGRRSDAEGVVCGDYPCSPVKDAVEECRAGHPKQDRTQAWPLRHERPLGVSGSDHAGGGDKGRTHEVKGRQGEKKEHRRDYNREADNQSAASRQWGRDG